jgi:hypothetical protein
MLRKNVKNNSKNASAVSGFVPARWVYRLFFLAAMGSLLFGFLACRMTPKIEPVTPHPPDESLQTTIVYPDDPVLLDEAEFQRCLTTLAEQLTVLYLRASDCDLPPAELRTLRDIQKQFYRYGVQVLLIDRSDPMRWPELKQRLTRAGANFPTAYLKDKKSAFLSSFLQTDFSGDNQLWIIDVGRDEKIFIPRPISTSRLVERIKQILITRSAPAEADKY